MKGDESLEKGIMISKQGGVGFKESLTPFGGGAMETRDNEGDAGYVVIFFEGDRLHTDIQFALMKEGGGFGCLSIEGRLFCDLRYFDRSGRWYWQCRNWRRGKILGSRSLVLKSSEAVLEDLVFIADDLHFIMKGRILRLLS